jgi:hypothetical protein
MGTPQRFDTEERTKAAKIKAALAEETTYIRNQKNLTREGKSARIAKAIVTAQGRLAELRQAEAQRLTARRETLHRQLFGTRHADDARIASIRDARDRAAKLDKDINKAREVMTRADRDGDHVLLRAYAEEIARRASNPLDRAHGWGELFREWVANQTGGDDAIQELEAINTELTDPGQRMVREATFGVGALPPEVRGVGNLKALADQADEISELPPTRAEQIGAHLAKFARAELE